MTMEIFRDLPKELVEEEILTHVPARNLKRLGSTCKRWNRLFYGDRRFARKHSDKAAKEFVLLMLTRDYRICPTVVNLDGKVPTLEVKRELSLVDSKYPGAQFDVGAVLHCEGLLLCTSADESRLVVWNLITGEARWLQPSYKRYRGRFFALGYGGDNKSHKVLTFCHGEKDFEIYEFSSDSWRVVDDVIAPGWMLRYSTITVSLKGSTYWFAQDGTKTESIVSLVRFDFSTEKCVPVPLPYQSHRFAVASLSVVKDEKLSVMLQRHEITSKTEIWVTNKIDETTPQVVSWSMLLSLDLSPGLQLFNEERFLLDEEKKVVMISVNWLDFEDETECNNKDMICIVGEDNQVTQVDFGLETSCGGCLTSILNYVPSFVQIEPAGGKRKRGDM